MRNERNILIDSPLQISSPDTPPLSGCRVNTVEELMDIENPYIGQQVYVIGTGKTYIVRSLKRREIGGMIIENAQIDRYEEFGSPTLKNVVSFELEEDAPTPPIFDQNTQVEIIETELPEVSI